MIAVLTSIFSGLLKALITPLLFVWSGVNLAKRKAAERGVQDANDANKRREEIRGLDDDDLDDRVRRSQR
jgi:NhaP-type Na+/H+ or K+/H+ antiporter